MDNENVINLGEWKVPTKWDDLTLKQFQEIERYYSDKDRKFDARDVIHILCDKSVDEVNALPMSFTEDIMEKLMFLQERPNEEKPSNSVMVDGVKYSINAMEKLKTGEYIAIDTALKSDRFDYASFFAIMCRREGEVYDSRYEAELFNDRREMWLSQPITKLFPLIAFFLNLYIVYQTPILLSLEIQGGINHIRENIKISRENGELSALSTRRLMRRLKKLEKSLNSI